MHFRSFCCCCLAKVHFRRVDSNFDYFLFIFWNFHSCNKHSIHRLNKNEQIFHWTIHYLLIKFLFFLSFSLLQISRFSNYFLSAFPTYFFVFTFHILLKHFVEKWNYCLKETNVIFWKMKYNFIYRFKSIYNYSFISLFDLCETHLYNSFFFWRRRNCSIEYWICFFHQSEKVNKKNFPMYVSERRCTFSLQNQQIHLLC